MDIILFIIVGFLLVGIGYLFGKKSKDVKKTEVLQNEDKTDWEQMAEKILW